MRNVCAPILLCVVGWHGLATAVKDGYKCVRGLDEVYPQWHVPLSHVQRFLGVPPLVFFSEHFEREAVHVAGGAGGVYADLLTIHDVDEILERGGSVFHPTKRHMEHGSDWLLIKRARDEDGEWWTSSPNNDTISLQTAHGAFSRGYSVLINRVNYRWYSIYQAAAFLEAAIGPRINVNLYLSPYGGDGAFEAHFDWMDALVVQIHGYKSWNVYDALVNLPRHDMKFKPSSAELKMLGPPESTLLLSPGHVLYIPRGMVHEAFTLNNSSCKILLQDVDGTVNGRSSQLAEPSLHLTFGIEISTHYSTEILMHFIVRSILGRMETVGEFQADNLKLFVGEGHWIANVRVGDVDMQWKVPALIHITISLVATTPKGEWLRRMTPLTREISALIYNQTGSLGKIITATFAQRVGPGLLDLLVNITAEEIARFSCERTILSYLAVDSNAVIDRLCASMSRARNAETAKVDYLLPFLTAPDAIITHKEPSAIVCNDSLLSVAQIFSRIFEEQGVSRVWEEILCEAWAGFIHNIVQEKQERYNGMKTHLRNCGQFAHHAHKKQ